MSIFSRLFGESRKRLAAASKPATEKLPADWKEILRQCNFFTARRAFERLLRFFAAQGAAEGGYYAFKDELLDGWDRFEANPCYTTAVQWIEDAPEAFAICFVESCPGGVEHRRRTGTASTFPLTEYHIGERIDTAQGLKKLSIFEERSLFSASLCFRPVGELTKEERPVIPHRLDGEVLYHAPPITWLGENAVVVGAVNGFIQKIAVSHDLGASDDQRESVRHLFEYCEDLLGTPTREMKEANLFQWETSDGNVTLVFAGYVTLVFAGFRHPGNNAVIPCVHLVITSKSC